MSNFLKSGIGSCIAPKAGLARHPVKGRYTAEGTFRIFGFWYSRLGVAPGQGAAGETWLFYRQAKKARVQAKYNVNVNVNGGGGTPPLVKNQTISDFFS